MTDASSSSVLEAVRMIVAYVGNNAVSAAELPRLIAQTHAAVVALTEAASEPVKPVSTPAVEIRKSITANHLISFEDGRKFKSLKRHLSVLGITPDQYRKKWGLPHDYPMVAANYSKKRAAIAKSINLGRKPHGVVEAAEPSSPAAPLQKRTRSSK